MIKKKDLPYEINGDQIQELIKLAKPKPNDVFYDLGSARGRVIIVLARDTNVKKAIGIEYERDLHDEARKSALKKLDKRALGRTDFWFANMDIADENGDGYFYNLDDATVVYYGLDEDDTTIKHFAKLFGRKRHVRIITKNLPLVGYESIANRANPECWFFLMRNPPKSTRSKKEWARSVLGTDHATMDKVYDYYAAQIAKQYPNDTKYCRAELLTLRKLVNERF